MGASGVFLARLVQFFGVLERFGLDFGRFWVGSGWVLEAPWAVFSRFFRAVKHALSEGSECNKTTVFAMV